MADITPEQSSIAICGAYLMTAFADARYDDVEESRLLSSLINEPDIAFIDSAILEKIYNELSAAFGDEYAATSEIVLDAIRSVKDDATLLKAVIKAARLAIVADQKILPQEDHVLRQIADALSVETGAV